MRRNAGVHCLRWYTPFLLGLFWLVWCLTLVPQPRAVLNRKANFVGAKLLGKITARDFRFRHARTFEIGFAKVDTPQISTAKVGIAKVQTFGVHFTQVESAIVFRFKIASVERFTLCVELINFFVMQDLVQRVAAYFRPFHTFHASHLLMDYGVLSRGLAARGLAARGGAALSIDGPLAAAGGSR